VTVTVEVSNTYACGRESTRITRVRGPVPGEGLDDWWQDVVHPLTGDGHPCGASEHALYEATVVRADDPELLPGDTYTWEG
jgi:hypothetical protein